MRLQATMRRHPKLWAAALLAAAVPAVFVLVWFQPQKLFIDDEVNEAVPGAASAPISDDGGGERVMDEDAAGREKDPQPREMVLANGAFRPLAHAASGRAKILEIGGDRYLRFEDFMVENGPDLRVYLSAAKPSSEGPAFGADFVDLGALKGNIGDQNYRIPGDLDLERFPSAVIWCRRFSVGFAVAPVAT